MNSLGSLVGDEDVRVKKNPKEHRERLENDDNQQQRPLNDNHSRTDHDTIQNIPSKTINPSDTKLSLPATTKTSIFPSEPYSNPFEKTPATKNDADDDLPPPLNRRIDLHKLPLTGPQLHNFIHTTLKKLLGLHDEVLERYVIEMLESERYADAKKMWGVLEAFLEGSVGSFMKSLWEVLIYGVEEPQEKGIERDRADDVRKREGEEVALDNRGMMGRRVGGGVVEAVWSEKGHGEFADGKLLDRSGGGRTHGRNEGRFEERNDGRYEDGRDNDRGRGKRYERERRYGSYYYAGDDSGDDHRYRRRRHGRQRSHSLEVRYEDKREKGSERREHRRWPHERSRYDRGRDYERRDDYWVYERDRYELQRDSRRRRDHDDYDRDRRSRGRGRYLTRSRSQSRSPRLERRRSHDRGYYDYSMERPDERKFRHGYGHDYDSDHRYDSRYDELEDYRNRRERRRRREHDPGREYEYDDHERDARQRGKRRYGDERERAAMDKRPRLDYSLSKGKILRHLNGSSRNKDTWSRSRRRRRSIDKKGSGDREVSGHDIQNGKEHSSPYSDGSKDDVEDKGRQDLGQGDKSEKFEVEKSHAEEDKEYSLDSNDLRHRISNKKSTSATSAEQKVEDLRSKLRKLKQEHLRARAMKSIKKHGKISEEND